MKKRVRVQKTGQRGKIARKTPLNHEEERFMYALCRWYLGKQQDIAEIYASARGAVREEVLYDYLVKNGCAGLFFKCIDEAGLQVPPDCLERYRSEYMAVEMNNLFYAGAAAEVDRMCRDLDINYVMMKGMALVETVYEETGIRPQSDIDLIVESREQAERLVDRMPGPRHTGVNFSARRYKDWVRTGGTIFIGPAQKAVEVEIYFPVENAVLPMPELFFNISGRLFQSAEQGQNFSLPDPSSHFLTLLVHLVHHHLGARLAWYLDIALAIEKHKDRLDWDFILHQCRRLELSGALSFILEMLGSRFGAAIPAEVLERARAEGRPGYNRGILAEMVSPRNVVMDSLGGGHIWLYPAISISKLKTVLLYSLFMFLFLDQSRFWFRFNLGGVKKQRVLGESVFIFLFKYKFIHTRTVFKRIAGVFFGFLFSLIALPFHVYYNLKRKCFSFFDCSPR